LQYFGDSVFDSGAGLRPSPKFDLQPRSEYLDMEVLVILFSLKYYLSRLYPYTIE
jgi:hypothetical protein